MGKNEPHVPTKQCGVVGIREWEFPGGSWFLTMLWAAASPGGQPLAWGPASCRSQELCWSSLALL